MIKFFAGLYTCNNIFATISKRKWQEFSTFKKKGSTCDSYDPINEEIDATRLKVHCALHLNNIIINLVNVSKAAIKKNAQGFVIFISP